MKKYMKILILILLPILSFSQREINLDNNLTGMYSNSTTGTQFGLNFIGNNSIDIKKLNIDVGTNYSTRFNPKISENELIQRLNIGYEKERWDIFGTYQYNYSLIRKINADSWFGLGGGLKKKFSFGKISLSYAFIYERISYDDKPSDEILRNSLRLKIKIEKSLFGFSSEYYFQPSIILFEDQIIYGTTKIILFPKRQLNFIIQDVVNYRSNSDVKLIHNLTFGVSYKFNKKVEKNENKEN